MKENVWPSGSFLFQKASIRGKGGNENQTLLGQPELQLCPPTTTIVVSNSDTLKFGSENFRLLSVAVTAIGGIIYEITATSDFRRTIGFGSFFLLLMQVICE